MTTPVMLMALALLFWGWQVNMPYFGVIMAILLEGSRRVTSKWEFSDVDLRRIWSLCTLLFLAATVISFVSNDGTSGLLGLLEGGGVNRTESLNATTRSVLVLLQWFPIVFFPMMAAQAYGAGDKMDARVFSWFLRKRHARNPKLPAPPSFNISYPYFIVCLLSASTSNQHRSWFFFGLAGLVAMGLWGQRSRRYSAAAWISVLLLAGAIGYGGQLGLRQLQGFVQKLDSVWLSRLGGQKIDRSSTVTDLGAVGRLKMSGRIVLRVEPETKPVPMLLREVSYNEFQSPSRWYSAQKLFNDVLPEDATTWELLPGKELVQSVLVSRYMKGGRGLLAVPNGTSRLEDLNVFHMKTNAMGVLKVNDGPGVISYRARFGSGRTIDSPPETNGVDTFVPLEEREAVERLAVEWKLRGLKPEQVLQRVRGMFMDRFEYSTYLEKPVSEAITPLADFLLHSRTGHCEYFAAASVFLLRAAGVPARYAVGYSVQEQKGDKFVVRGRHAHAWCLAYVDGAWRDFDATPPSWNAVESGHAPFWEPLTDSLSDLWFAFSKWRWSEPGIRKYLPWLVVPPLGIVIFRLIVRRQWRRSRRGPAGGAVLLDFPGTDSEFYLVEKALGKEGLVRRSGESLRNWVMRARESGVAGGELLEEVVSLHYRYRFDPEGLDQSERAELRRVAERWLAVVGGR